MWLPSSKHLAPRRMLWALQGGSKRTLFPRDPTHRPQKLGVPEKGLRQRTSGLREFIYGVDMSPTVREVLCARRGSWQHVLRNWSTGQCFSSGGWGWGGEKRSVPQRRQCLGKVPTDQGKPHMFLPTEKCTKTAGGSQGGPRGRGSKDRTPAEAQRGSLPVNSEVKGRRQRLRSRNWNCVW